MGLAQLNQADPAIVEALKNAGAMIPGHPNIQNRGFDTIIYHRKNYDAGGHTNLTFFDAPLAKGTTNCDSGRLDSKKIFHCTGLGVRIVPGVNFATGADIAAASSFSQAAVAGQPAALTVYNQWHRIMETGRVTFTHEDFEWTGEVPGLYHYPWGAGPAGVVGGDSGNLANLVQVAIPVNGLPNRARKLMNLAILGDSPFKLELNWPALATLGTAAAGNTAGFAEVGLFGTMYSNGNR